MPIGGMAGGMVLAWRLAMAVVCQAKACVGGEGWHGRRVVGGRGENRIAVHKNS